MLTLAALPWVAAHRDAGHPHDTVEDMIGLGRAWHQMGRTADALRQLRAAEALAAEIANPQRLAEVRAALAEAGEVVALPGGLTARQAEVLRLLASGLSNKEIAGQLYLSPATVERHLATVYRKLAVTGRVEADEAFVGGEEEGVHGRQTETKAMIAVAAEEDGRGIGRIRMQCIPDGLGRQPDALHRGLHRTG